MTGNFLLIAGPCAAETKEQVLETASQLAASGIAYYRAGVWKPRTMPGFFEGVGTEALAWLQEVKRATGVPVATEVSSAEHVRLALDAGIDCLWLGARTTTNPFLVQEIANAIALHPNRPSSLLVKNPMSPDVKLWQGAIERLLQTGVREVMAVHRGFQNGQPSDYRNAPMWSIPFELRRRMPKVPLLLDASHMAGRRELIPDLCQRALDLGYEGLMLEVHCCPEEALSDSEQQLSPADLQSLISSLHLRRESTDTGLRQLRSRLDETDDAIWALILQRMQISREIGDYKRLHDIPVLQSCRFAEIQHRRILWAEEHGLSVGMVNAILDALHEESCKQQL